MKFSRLFLFPLAAASLLVGCGGSGGDNNDSTAGGVAFSLFTPATEQQVPIPSDLFFADGTSPSGLTTDTTLNFPGADGNPLFAQANFLDGFSTTEALFTDFIGADIDIGIANAGGVLLISSVQGALQPGVDFEVTQSTVVAGRPRLLIRPLRPLREGTTHFVILTGDMRTTTGTPIVRARQFEIASNPNEVGSAENPAPEFSAQQQGLLEQIRRVLIRPIFERVIDPNPNIDGDSVVLAYSFTTESIGESLDFLADNPSVNPNAADEGGIRVQPAPDGMGGQLSTGEVPIGTDANGNPVFPLPDTANVFVGTFDLPYYLENNDNPPPQTSPPTPPGPANTLWLSNGMNAGGDSALPSPLGGFAACSNFQASVSTTKCFPQPNRRSVETVPVIVTVPNENSPSGGMPPAGGWPVVIFQHGITRNRLDVFPIAPALAAAGFVVVAIDIPLHGVPPAIAPAPENPFRIAGLERTFDLDSFSSPDGFPGSGDNFINLANLLNSRDNFRQAVSDVINLNATLRAGDVPVFDGSDNPPVFINLDNDNTHYVGHSLGGIIGATVLGVTERSELGAASLAMPGGGIARLLDGSRSFGPVISAGLAGPPANIREGSDTYEIFLQFTQQINDTSDPINHAFAANENHPIHMIEIVGGSNGGNNPPDLVVPNFVVRNVAAGGPCPASAQFLPFLDTACEPGPLSGTNPLANEQGLNMVTISPPYTSPAIQPSADTVIRFTAGHHGSILDPGTGTTPAGSVNAGEAFRTFCEIQSQIANFLGQAASGLVPDANLTIPVGVTDCTPPGA